MSAEHTVSGWPGSAGLGSRGEVSAVQVIEGAGEFVEAGEAHWVEQLRAPDLSVGTYSIPGGGVDDQSPHTEDEIYVCTGGRATLSTPSGDVAIAPGAVV